MPLFRLAQLLLCTILPASILPAAQEGIGPFSGPKADAEAARLYSHADDFVKNVVESKYSYAYMQFYWKRAGSNIDRIRRAYPESPTARSIEAGDLAVGGFPVKYFKERVLPRLEEKKVASFDAVNCAIFIYGLEENTDEAGKRELLRDIIQVLCRQIRWGEALAFPVLDEDRAWLWNIVAGQAAIYHNDELVEELLTNIHEESKPTLLETVARGFAFRGTSPEDMEEFFSEHGDAAGLRLSTLEGYVRREIPIARAVRHSLTLKGLYDGVDGIQEPEVRIDLEAFLSTIPESSRAAANAIYARFLAGTGRWDEARKLAPRDPVVAGLYLDFLVFEEQYAAALESLKELQERGLGDEIAETLLVSLARAGRTDDAAALRESLAPRIGAERAAFLEIRGRLLSIENQFVARERSFADIPISDRNLTARLICEWSLTPNRTMRGATPWDAVVYKFAPAFENLPEPTDKRKIEAAGR